MPLKQKIGWNFAGRASLQCYTRAEAEIIMESLFDSRVFVDALQSLLMKNGISEEAFIDVLASLSQSAIEKFEAKQKEEPYYDEHEDAGGV